MLYDSKTPDEYISDLPEDRKETVSKLRKIILRNLPEGFEEIMFGMLGYVVPLRTYPKGYHIARGAAAFHGPGLPEEPHCLISYGSLFCIRCQSLVRGGICQKGTH